MVGTMRVQADLNASDEQPISEVARRLGLRASALRYYDERGLVTPSRRSGGRRWYGRAELRRLALVKIAQRIRIPLDAVGAILDAPDPEWRSNVREQIALVDELIEQAKGARLFLQHALECPSERPARDCPSMVAALDHLLDGGSMEQLRREQYGEHG